MKANSQKKILVLGGIKSGKSRFALEMAQSFPPPRIFLATAEPFNEEMERKIRAHQEERGDSWQTIEAPINLPKALQEIPQAGICLIDCLTVWLGNLFYYQKDIDMYCTLFLKTLQSISFPLIIVSNEIGLCPTPFERETRLFAETLGKFNQELAKRCDQTYFIVAGKAILLD